MANKIKSYLSETNYKLEFSHTILHNKSAFDKFGNPIKEIIAPPVESKKVPLTARDVKAIHPKIEGPKLIISKIPEKVSAKNEIKEKPKLEKMEIQAVQKADEKIIAKEKSKTPTALDYLNLKKKVNQKEEKPDNSKISVEEKKKERLQNIEKFMRQKAPILYQKDNRAKTPISRKNSSPTNKSDLKERSPSDNKIGGFIKERIEQLRKKSKEDRKAIEQKLNGNLQQYNSNNDDVKDKDKAAIQLREEERKKMYDDIKQKKKASKQTPIKDIEWPGRYLGSESNDKSRSNDKDKPTKEKIAHEIIDHSSPTDVAKLEIVQKQLIDIVEGSENDDHSIEMEQITQGQYSEREDSVDEDASKDVVPQKCPSQPKESIETTGIECYMKSLVGPSKALECYELFKSLYVETNGLCDMKSCKAKLSGVLSNSEVEYCSGLMMAMLYQELYRQKTSN